MKQQSILSTMINSQRSHRNSPVSRSTFTVSSLSNQSIKNSKPDTWHRLFNNPGKPMSFQEKRNRRSETPSTSMSTPVLEPEDEIHRAPRIPTPIQNHIESLYEQVKELTVQLTQERVQHGRAQKKCEDLMVKYEKEKKTEFDALLNQHVEDHKKKLKEQEEKYIVALEEEQARNRQREERLIDELNFVKHTFHVYKKKLIEEQEKLTQTKIQQLQMNLKYEERSDFEEKSKQSDKDESVINDEQSDASFASKTTDSMTKISTTANIKSTKSKLRAIHRFRRSKSTDSEHKSTTHRSAVNPRRRPNQ